MPYETYDDLRHKSGHIYKKLHGHYYVLKHSKLDALVDDVVKLIVQSGIAFDDARDVMECAELRLLEHVGTAPLS